MTSLESTLHSATLVWVLVAGSAADDFGMGFASAFSMAGFGIGSCTAASGSSGSGLPASAPQQPEGQASDKNNKRRRKTVAGVALQPAAAQQVHVTPSAPAAASGVTPEKTGKPGRPKRDLAVACDKIFDEFASVTVSGPLWTVWFGEDSGPSSCDACKNHITSAQD